MPDLEQLQQNLIKAQQRWEQTVIAHVNHSPNTLDAAQAAWEQLQKARTDLQRAEDAIND